MFKELTPQLEHQLPSELEGAWVQVVDKTRYDEKCAVAKQAIDANTHWLFHPRISRRSPLDRCGSSETQRTGLHERVAESEKRRQRKAGWACPLPPLKSYLALKELG